MEGVFSEGDVGSTSAMTDEELMNLDANAKIMLILRKYPELLPRHPKDIEGTLSAEEYQMLRFQLARVLDDWVSRPEIGRFKVKTQ